MYVPGNVGLGTISYKKGVSGQLSSIDHYFLKQEAISARIREVITKTNTKGTNWLGLNCCMLSKKLVGCPATLKKELR